MGIRQDLLRTLVWMAEKAAKAGDGEIKQAFGRVLRRLRDANALSQEALAASADCTQPYLSLLEKGTNGPSLMRLFSIAEALQTTPHDLVLAVEEELRHVKGEPLE